MHASLDECADLVAELLDGPCDLGGYSFGGRVALHVALRHPALVARLVLLSATRGIADEALRAERRRQDETLANRIEAIGVEAFLDEWLAQPLFADLPVDPVERDSRSRDPYGLAESLRRCGTGTQDWLGNRLGGVRAPTLTVAGELDHKFREEAVAIATGVHVGVTEVIANVGHAAHLAQPDVTARTFNRFLN